MIVVYIGGPFRAATAYKVFQNINKAEALAYEVWAAGMVAICPHNNTRHFDGELTDSVWLDGDLELLKRSDAMILVEGWERSKGASAEVAFAQDQGIPVFTTIQNLLEWKGLSQGTRRRWVSAVHVANGTQS